MSTIWFAHKFVVKNFGDLCVDQITGQPCIRSDVFSPPYDNSYEFQLKIYPKADEESIKNKVSFYLRMIKCPTKSVLINWRLAMLDSKQHYCNIKDDQDKFAGSSWGYGGFISYNKLFDSANDYMTNGTVNFFCEGEIIEDYMSTDELSDMLSEFKESKGKCKRAHGKTIFNARVETIPFAYEWTIANFKIKSEAGSINSPHFSPSTGKELEFFMRMKTNHSEHKGFMSLYLFLETSPIETVLVNYRCSILDQEGNKSNTEVSQYKFVLDKGNGWGEYKNLLSLLKLHNNNLILLCEGEVLTEANNMSTTELANHKAIFACKEFSYSTKRQSSQVTVQPNTMTGLSQLFGNVNLSDYRIECDGLKIKTDPQGRIVSISADHFKLEHIYLSGHVSRFQELSD